METEKTNFQGQMDVCYVCKEPAREVYNSHSDQGKYNGKLVKCGVEGCTKIMHPDKKCSTKCKNSCKSYLCHEHKELFKNVKTSSGFLSKCCSVCSRICTGGCNERFFVQGKFECCEECDAIRKGSCMGCYVKFALYGNYCADCYALK